MIILYWGTLKSTSDPYEILVWARCAHYPGGFLIPVFKSAGFIPRIKKPSLNDSDLLQLVQSGPAVPIYEELILNLCRIWTKYTHEKKKGKCGLKILVTTRSLIVNNFTKKYTYCISINEFYHVQRSR